MRKDMKLDVEEFIKAEVKAPAVLEDYFKAWKEHIMKETRSLSLDFVREPSGERTASWEVEKHRVDIALSSLHLKERTKEFSKVPGLSRRQRSR
jgi:isoleucyl-tRNA synthetase